MKFWITIALLLAALGLSALGARHYPDTLAVPLETIRPQIAGWYQTNTQALEPRTLQTLKPTSYLSRLYRKNGDELGLFVAFYEQQRAGESMHSPKACLPASGWEIWKYESANMLVQGKVTPINKYFIQKNGQRMIVLYWYQSKERIIASEYAGKFLLMRDALMSGHTAGGLVRVTVPDRPGMAEQAVEFATELTPQVQKCFHS